MDEGEDIPIPEHLLPLLWSDSESESESDSESVSSTHSYSQLKEAWKSYEDAKDSINEARKIKRARFKAHKIMGDDSDNEDEDKNENLPARPSMTIHEYKKSRRCKENQFKKENHDRVETKTHSSPSSSSSSSAASTPNKSAHGRKITWEVLQQRFLANEPISQLSQQSQSTEIDSTLPGNANCRTRSQNSTNSRRIWDLSVADDKGRGRGK